MGRALREVSLKYNLGNGINQLKEEQLTPKPKWVSFGCPNKASLSVQHRTCCVVNIHTAALSDLLYTNLHGVIVVYALEYITRIVRKVLCLTQNGQYSRCEIWRPDLQEVGSERLQSKVKEEFKDNDILDALYHLNKKSLTPLMHIPVMQLFTLPRMRPEETMSMQLIVEDLAAQTTTTAVKLPHVQEQQKENDSMPESDCRDADCDLGVAERFATEISRKTSSSLLTAGVLPDPFCVRRDVFQKLIHDTFADLPGVTGIADDIMIFGFQEDGSYHDKNFQALIIRASERNIKFNEEKLILKQRSIPSYGHMITDQGVKPDPQKVKAIEAMELQSLRFKMARRSVILIRGRPPPKTNARKTKSLNKDFGNLQQHSEETHHATSRKRKQENILAEQLFAHVNQFCVSNGERRAIARVKTNRLDLLTGVTTLCSFLGMANYMSRFTKKLLTITALL
ncbi:hypothetical protein CAPTEDRAFT_209027 [Capitella teleta]|uniref:Reverse transcriptase domain-containing protein n=1 Tax=Capitella teleta TaxID=283909 RepID=R7V7H1_CAPTE|nr:hypothetical protein CAPTEDRAFT_209027 [Capitella teleta]|eukprot:ELU11680.1 hypothetical protein CAPTEDRAFT_209027 [Capitella teleta]